MLTALDDQAQENQVREKRAFEILAERGEIVFEFYPADPAEAEKLSSILSIDRKSGPGYRAYADYEGFLSFLKLGIPYTIIEAGPAKKSGGSMFPFPGSWNAYPSHYQYMDFMQAIARDYPAIAELDTIGQSVQGRQILVMKISDHPDQREAEPAFVYSSTMHGDETAGYVLLLRLIDYLCSNYEEDTMVTRLVNNLEIWINPLANPDGTYWKGDSLISLPKRFNANNVDLNRNFPGINGPHPDKREYQPENLSQMDFLREIYMVAGANIHGGAEVINYPYDALEIIHADNNWYVQTSREYAEEAQTRSFPLKYMQDLDKGITNGWAWYEANGTRQDWVNLYNYAREVTIEISLDKDPPGEDLPFYWYYNYPSMLRYMEHSLYGLHGIIRDKSNGQALKANLLVRGHDDKYSTIFSDSVSGFFARPIEAGSFDIEISCAGFEPEVIHGVRASKDQTTWLQIDLRPLKTAGDDVSVMDGPLPAYFSGDDLILTEDLSGLQRVFLYDMNGRLVIAFQIHYSEEDKYSIPLEGYNVGPGIYLLQTVSSDGMRTRKVFKTE